MISKSDCVAHQLHRSGKLWVFRRALEHLKEGILFFCLFRILPIETAEVLARHGINEFVIHLTPHLIIFIQNRVLRFAYMDAY